jgi:hypothetical protein
MTARMSKTSLSTVARDLHEITALLAANIDTAVRNIDDALAGWPSTEPGSAGTTECPHPDCAQDRPCPTHDGNLARDNAALALASLSALYDIKTRARRLEITVTRWATSRTDDTTVARRINDIDVGLWCENCARYGHRNVRREDGRYCEFCQQVKGSKLSGGKLPNARLLDIKATRRVYEQDIARCFAKPRATTIRQTGSARADVQAAAAERREKRMTSTITTSPA